MPKTPSEDQLQEISAFDEGADERVDEREEEQVEDGNVARTLF